jgi:hypothetical protein
MNSLINIIILPMHDFFEYGINLRLFMNDYGDIRKYNTFCQNNAIDHDEKATS